MDDDSYGPNTGWGENPYDCPQEDYDNHLEGNLD